MTVILLFNLLFRSMSSFRGVQPTAVELQSLCLEEAGVVFFSVSEAPDAISRLHVDLTGNGPLVVV